MGAKLFKGTGVIREGKVFTVLDAWANIIKPKEDKVFFKGEYFISMEIIEQFDLIIPIFVAGKEADFSLLYKSLMLISGKEEREFINNLFNTCLDLEVFPKHNGVIIKAS